MFHYVLFFPDLEFNMKYKIKMFKIMKKKKKFKTKFIKKVKDELPLKDINKKLIRLIKLYFNKY